MRNLRNQTRERNWNIVNLVDVYNAPAPSISREDDDKSDDDNVLATDIQKGYQARTSNDEKDAMEGNLTSGWLREMEALNKTNLLRREFKVRGQFS